MKPLLDDQIKDQVRRLFSHLEKRTAILFFTNEEACGTCSQIDDLLSEIGGLSEKIQVFRYRLEKDAGAAAKFGVTRAPVLVIAEMSGEEIIDHGIRFAGIPAGHEFLSFINAVLMVSTHKVSLSQNTIEKLHKVSMPVDLQIFTTPTCPYCPSAVILGQQMAFINSHIKATMVNAVEFQADALKYGVQGVPHTVINDGAGTLIGSEPEEALLDEILKVGQ